MRDIESDAKEIEKKWGGKVDREILLKTHVWNNFGEFPQL